MLSAMKASRMPRGGRRASLAFAALLALPGALGAQVIVRVNPAPLALTPPTGVLSTPRFAPSFVPALSTPLLTPRFQAPMPLPQALPRAKTADPVGTAPNTPTGEIPMPSQSGPVDIPATPEELTFVAKASAELATLADDAAAAKGLKASQMTGKDFLDILAEVRERCRATYKGFAPTPRAYAGALAVQEQTERVVRALIDPSKPLYDGIHRALSVWNVFNQEMERVASETGTVEAVEAEARLFAQQVEDSVGKQ
jgi:hypothetical protein